jgi:hypothetical protein
MHTPFESYLTIFFSTLFFTAIQIYYDDLTAIIMCMSYELANTYLLQYTHKYGDFLVYMIYNMLGSPQL